MEEHRIDIEKNGDGVLVKAWYAGWQPNTPANRSGRLPGTSIFAELKQLEARGYSCTQFDNDHAQALKGPITRIDFVKIGAGVVVKKYPFGWTAHTNPISVKSEGPEFDFEFALNWCRENGWTVHTWPDGARAWKGEVLPVRTVQAILRLRRQNPHEQADLAYDR